MHTKVIGKRILAGLLSLQVLIAGAPATFAAAEAEDADGIFTADGLTYKVLSEPGEGDGTVQVGDGKSVVQVSGSVKIPPTVTNGEKTYDVVGIGDRAFMRQTDLTSVTLPDSVTDIGKQSFFGTGLEKFKMNDSVATIGEECFRTADKLETVTLSENLSEIPKDAFDGCTALRKIEIPEGVSDVEEAAFLSCTSLQKVSLPASLEAIGERAFWQDEALNTLLIAEDSQLEEVGDGAFQWCSSLEAIDLPADLKKIGSSAFSDCGSLKSVGIETDTESQLESLGESAFRSTQLSDFYFPDTLTEIGERPFGSCAKLKSLTVGENNSLLKSVNGVLFNKDGNELLVYPPEKEGRAYKIPQGVTKIAKYAFWGASDLQEVTMSDGVLELGEFVFQDASSLKSVIFADSVTDIGRLSFYNNETLENVRLPDSLEELAGNTFYNCESLKEIRIPKNISKMAGSVFGSCPNLVSIKVLSDKLATVEDGAFNGTSEDLKISVLNDSIKSLVVASGIGEGQVSVDGSEEPEPEPEPEPEVTSFTVDQIQYKVLSQGSETEKATVQVGDGKNGMSVGGKIEIPATVEYMDKIYDVTAVGDFAFSESSITEITLPKSITAIGDSAFIKCSKLTSFQIPSGVRSIGSRAVADCESLKAVTYTPDSSLEELGDGALGDNQALEIALLPNTLKKVGTHLFLWDISLKTVEFQEGSQLIVLPEGTFLWCMKLETIDLPVGIAKIDAEAFYECQSLKEVGSLPGVTEIGENAFYDCRLLKEVTLGDGLKELNNGAFYTCTGLTAVKVGSSVGAIGTMVSDNEDGLKGVFEGCTALSQITLPASVKTIGKNVFRGCAALSRIEILSDALNSVGANAFLNVSPNAQFVVRNEAVKNTLINTAFVSKESILVKTPEPGNDFKAVSKILNIPTEAKVGVPLTLTGTVVPSDATNQAIKWELAGFDNRIGASITGNLFTATAAGTVTVQAVVEKGISISEPYVQNFKITVKAAEKPSDHDHSTNNGGGSGSFGRGGRTVIVSGTAPDNKPVVTVQKDPQGKPVVTVGARALPNAKPLTAADIAKKATDGTLNGTVNPNGVWDGKTVGAKNIALVIDTKEATLAPGGSYQLGVSAFAGSAGSTLRVRASRDGFVTITANPDGTYTITSNKPVSGLYILVEILDANGNVVGHSSMKLDAATGLGVKHVENKAATIV